MPGERMDRLAKIVRSALAALCERAGVDQADGAPEAGIEILKAIRSQGINGIQLDPEECPVAQWLKIATGMRHEQHTAPRDGAYLLVTPDDVMVMGPVPAGGTKREFHLEPLPAAVRIAVARSDKPYRVPTREESQDTRADIRRLRYLLKAKGVKK